MAKIQLGLAPTNVKLRVKLMDSSVTTGAGLTGLTSASSGLKISTFQLIEGANGETSATTYTAAGSTIESITTIGTYAAPTATKIRFKEVDATNHPGIYELQIADARMSATGDATKPMTLLISISGATNLAQADIEIECRNQAVNVIQINGTAQTARDIGASVLLSSGTGTGQLDFTSGVVKSNMVQIDAQATNGNNATLNLKLLNIVNNAGTAVIMSSTANNGYGLYCSGNGTADGFRAIGGATGHGIYGLGGATSGDGMRVVSQTAGNGMVMQGAATGHGLSVGSGSGATGNGINVIASSTNGYGLRVDGSGTGAGALFYGGAQGSGLNIQGNGTASHGLNCAGAGTGHGLYATGGATGNGAQFQGGATSGGGLRVAAMAGNSTGMYVTGSGSEDAIKATGGATGVGMRLTGGATSGDGLACVSPAVGSGINSIGGGASGHGMVLTRGGASGYDFAGATPSSNIPNPISGTVSANVIQIAGQVTSAASSVTFPSSIASPTNITAGTITTVTNLTNAPTSGDFTATMKTSLNASTPASITGAVGSVTGNVGGNVVGSVGSVTGAVGSVTGAVGSVTGNVGGNVTGSVGSVAANGISATSIATGAITNAKFAAGAIDSVVLSAGAITNAKFAAGAIDAAAIATDAIGSAEFAQAAADKIWSSATRTLTSLSLSAAVDANIVSILGTAVSTPATAGILDVNVKNMNNVAATAITTINANQGTTQPVNYTGTGASAYVKTDMVNISGAAVNSATGQLGVNLVNAAGTAWGSGAITAGSIATGAITNAKFAAGAIDAAAIATDAIGSAEFAQAAADKIWSSATRTLTSLSLSAAVDANIVSILGTAVSTPATAGILDVNVKNMNNVAATAITTINANQGTTQPVNYTGTGASATVKTDIVNISGSAVATSAAQLGVNLVNISGSAVNVSAAQLGVNVINAAGTAWNSGAIQAATLASNTIGAAKIATGAITNTKFAAGAIDSAVLSAGAITNTKFAAGAIDSTVFAQTAADEVWVSSTRTLTSLAGLSANANVTQVDGVALSTHASGMFPADMRAILGTAVSTPATAGILDVNVKNMNNVAATAITTINANQGTTQPVNYTGTGASAYVKTDMVNISGAAVNSATGQLGVNLVNIAGSPVNVSAAQLGVNVVQVSGDATAATNLKSQFNTTGLTGDTFPARQDQLQNIVSTGAAINAAATGFVLSAGVQAAGTYLNTVARDGVVHQLQDTAGTLDAYYEFDIGQVGVPTSFQIYMANTGTNDTIRFFGWNWGSSTWVELGSKIGTTGITYSSQTIPMYTSMVGTGLNIGKVRIRFYNTGLTTSNTYVDQIFVSYAIVNQSVGYEDGAVWIDTINGVSGTTPYINGTADKPVLTYAEALTLATAMNLHKFVVVAGSSITLTTNHDYDSFMGAGGQWNLALDGQSVAGAYFKDANVSGTGIGSTPPTFRNCAILSGTTLPPTYFDICGFNTSAAFVAGAAGQYLFNDCMSLVPGSGTPQFNFSGTGGTTGINIRRWSGGTNITLDSNCTATIEVVTGGGQTVAANGANVEIRGICRAVTLTGITSATTAQIACVTGPISLAGANGTVRIYGVCATVTDSRTGSPTLVNEALSQVTIPDTVWDEMRSTHITSGSFGENVNADIVKISSDAVAADNLELQFDGTGIVGDTYPSRQDQLRTIASTGAATNAAMTSWVNLSSPVATTETGGVAVTVARDGVYDVLTNASQAADSYYETNIGGRGIPTGVSIYASVQNNSKTVAVYGYDWGSTTWVQIGTMTGTASLVPTQYTFGMYTGMVGTGANLGTVRLRFLSSSSGTTISTDQLYVSYATVQNSVGYLDGAVWIDTNNGTSGTTLYVNGTADKPVNTLADALTIANALGVKSLVLLAGSSITLNQSFANWHFTGKGTVNFNGQSIAGASFEHGLRLSGVSTGVFWTASECYIDSITAGAASLNTCGIAGTITLLPGSVFGMVDCVDANPAAISPIISFASSAAVACRGWKGGLYLDNMTSTNILKLDGFGRMVINSNCTGGDITIRGFFAKTDNVIGGFLGTLTETERYDRTQVSNAIWDDMRSNHSTSGTFGEYTNANISKVYNVSAAAQKLSISAPTMITGTVTSAAFAPTTTQFECVDITDAATDFYRYRTAIVTSGNLNRQARNITGYSKVGSNGRFTVDAFTGTLAHGDSIIIV